MRVFYDTTGVSGSCDSREAEDGLEDVIEKSFDEEEVQRRLDMFAEQFSPSVSIESCAACGIRNLEHDPLLQSNDFATPTVSQFEKRHLSELTLLEVDLDSCRMHNSPPPTGSGNFDPPLSKFVRNQTNANYYGGA